MNQEIAGKLLALRKQNGYSQEELAEKLGVSRQAVSKWERGDASPDTDNLIALAKIYDISLDKLFDLNPSDQSQRSSLSLKKKETEENGQRVMYPEGSYAEEKYTARKSVPESDSKNADPDVFSNYNYTYETQGSDQQIQAYQDNNAFTVSNGISGGSDDILKKLLKFPFAILAVILFFIFGSVNLWHPGWLVFLTIPLYYTGIQAARHKNPNIFCYPVFVTLIYLISGFYLDLWHPGWLVFLTIPLYYWVINILLGLGRNENTDT